MILFSPGLIRAFLFSDINIFNAILSSGVYACLKELKKNPADSHKANLLSPL